MQPVAHIALILVCFFGLANRNGLCAQTTSNWDIRGRLDASWRYRSHSNTNQNDQLAATSAYLDATATDENGANAFNFIFDGFLQADLNGLEDPGDSFFGLSDTREHSVRGFVYGAYAEAPVLSEDLRLRVGRQEIHRQDALYFDGAMASFDDGGPISATVYAGMPVRFYEDTRSGDLLLGAGVRWRVQRNFRLSLDQIYLRDKAPPGDPSLTVRNDLRILGLQWLRDEHTTVRASSSWLDNEPRRSEVSVFFNFPERGWWTRVHLRRQEDYGEVVATDLSPFAVTLGDVAPYWTAGAELHRSFSDSADLGIGFQGRWLNKNEDYGVFNREYNRWFAILTGHDFLMTDLEAGLRADVWNSSDADILAGGAFAAYEIEKGRRFEVGTDFSKYRYDLFTGNEYLDDRQIYGRVRYAVTDSASFRLRVARSRSQFGTDAFLEVSLALDF